MKIEINKAAVSAVLLTPSLKIVRVSRKDDHANFGLPGGKVEEGESLAEALVRELKEETGYDLVYDANHHPMIYAAYTKNGYMNYTYLILTSEESIQDLSSDESHVIQTCDLTELGLDKVSTFHIYNMGVASTTINLLINSNKELQ